MRRIIRRMRYEKELCRSSVMTNEQAQDILSNTFFHAAPSFEHNNHINKQYDLMIVVPVYNVERYLDECLQSVLSQKTQYSFCVVAVNDGSTDNSADVLAPYEKYDNVRIIHQQNKGLSGARNTAIEEINASYVFFLDSDDRLPDGTIEALVSAAYEHDADIVQGAYTKFNDNGEIGVFDKADTTCEIKSSALSGYACMKAIKAELLEKFCFPEGYLYEDTVMGKLLYPLCRKAIAVPQVVYEYRIHTATISGASQTAKNLDTYWITQYCLEEAAKRRYALDSHMYEQYLRQCWVNFLRTQYMAPDIQESMFIATAARYRQYFGNVKLQTKDHKLKLLHRAIKKRSFTAYRFLMMRWEIL